MKTLLGGIGLRVACCAALLLILTMAAVGCGQKVTMKEHDNTGGVAQSDQDKIKEYLDKAGIKGEIYTTADNGTEWVVEVGAPAPAPGQRAAPTMPIPYQVNKTTGKVTGG
jgi:hypothetical protein